VAGQSGYQAYIIIHNSTNKYFNFRLILAGYQHLDGNAGCQAGGRLLAERVLDRFRLSDTGVYFLCRIGEIVQIN